MTKKKIQDSRSKIQENKHKVSKYDPISVQKKWQEKWEQEGLYKFSLENKGEPYYNLVELPYPSGDLHLGHWFSFVTADAHARYKKMSGFNVFFPNGFDAFGLPAENAAIKRGIDPKEWTLSNIQTMRKQFDTMGTMIDWSHEAITCLPEYYRWNQWIFLRMLEKGIAYRGKALGNWCPVDQTVLANEHVEAGRCWRCGAEVVQKEIEQWFLKLTAYADELIWKDDQLSVLGSQLSEDSQSAIRNSETERQKTSKPVSENRQQKTDNRVDWPESVRVGQNNWIGKKEGINITYKVIAIPSEVEGEAISTGSSNEEMTVTVFTTRPDTNFGATFIALAPEHDLVSQVTSNKVQVSEKIRKEVEEYVEKAKKKTELERKAEGREKTGVFAGLYAINHLTGYKMPVWVSDFVLAGYGTGALVGVPGHDMRDFEFATKFGLKIIRVVVGKDKDTSPITRKEQVQEEEGTMVNSDFLNGMDIHEATKKIMDYMVEKGWGEKVTTYHIHDWSISRQRYWGTPIPVIYCEYCFKHKKTSVISTEGRDLQEISRDARNDKCIEGIDYTMINGVEHAIIPVPDGQLPVTLPEGVDFTPKGEPPLATAKDWLNVDCPKCGGRAKRDAETMDTFFDSAWYYYRYVNPHYEEGPFDRLRVKKIMPVDVYYGGAEHTLGHTLYARFFTKFFRSLGYVSFDEFATKRVQHGVILGPDGNRMSKSKGNVVNPDDLVKEYGTDAVRTYLCFMMPYEATAPWSPEGIWGSYRFLKRIWELQSKVSIQDLGFMIQENSSFSSEALAKSRSSGEESSRHQPEADRPLAEARTRNQLSNEDLVFMHKTIKKVGEDIQEMKFNTAVAALMTWLNHLESRQNVSSEEYKNLLLLVAPFAPHMTEELWQNVILNNKHHSELVSESPEKSGEMPKRVRHDGFVSIHKISWPIYDEKYLVEDEVSVVVQINGKMRDSVRITNYELRMKEKVEEKARESEKVQKHLEGQSIRKVIYVPGKILNFVI